MLTTDGELTSYDDYNLREGIHHLTATRLTPIATARGRRMMIHASI